MNTSSIMKIRPYLDNFSNMVIGHERLFEEMISQFPNYISNYPPHNLIKETEEKYRIEIAVAGFSKDKISVKTQENKLIIKSIPKEFEFAAYPKEKESKDTIIHKGIAERDFIKSFHLSEDVIVTDASFNNGVIIINLERIIPEEKKPKIFKL